MHGAFLPQKILNGASTASVVSWRSPRRPPRADAPSDALRPHLGHLAPRSSLVAFAVPLPARSWHVQDLWVLFRASVCSLQLVFRTGSVELLRILELSIEPEIGKQLNLT